MDLFEWILAAYICVQESLRACMYEYVCKFVFGAETSWPSLMRNQVIYNRLLVLKSGA